MKAIHDEQNFLVITIPGPDGEPVRLPNSPRFLDICGGIGWPDLAKQDSYALFWFVAVGQAEDGIYYVIYEIGGEEGEVCKAMIDWKDILFIKTIWHSENEDEKEYVQFLRDPDNADGLTFYEWIDVNEHTGLPKYLHPGSYWKHFRSYDHYASLIPVRPQLQANMLAGWQRIYELKRNNKLVTLEETPKTDWILGMSPPWKEVLEHPLAKALINCIGMMELTKPKDPRELIRPRPAYENWR